MRSEAVVIIKPNLVEALEPPITTPVELIDALVGYLQDSVPECRLIVGEGTGSVDYDTFHCFETLGYTQMASRRGVELLDLNVEPLTRKENPDCSRWPELYLPELLDEVFLLSVPVLKVHTLADVTLLDATVGMIDSHLWGRHCEPPVGRLAACWDPVAIDSYGASLLDMHWREIGHIELAHNVLGKAEPLDVVELQCTGKSSTRDLSRTAEHYSVAG